VKEKRRRERTVVPGSWKLRTALVPRMANHV
jgi:hypothetical protein